jgi:hypothetical protein
VAVLAWLRGALSPYATPLGVWGAGACMLTVLNLLKSVWTAAPALLIFYGVAVNLLTPIWTALSGARSGLRSISISLRSHLGLTIFTFTTPLILTTLRSSRLLPDYYRMNSHIWQEGLLIDWLQKKVFDKWVRRFLVHSSYLVSERVVFDVFVRFYIDYVVWPMHRGSIFDFRSVASLLTCLLIFAAILILTVNVLTVAASLL